VIDYQVSYDEASGTDFVILESNIVALEYTASGLVAGTAYLFKVQARNAFGLSAYTSELSLTTGFMPDTPDSPTTTISGN
jgi:hypothetical protein